MKIPLVLAPGMVSDDTDFSTGGWIDGSNFRFYLDKPETVKGYESLKTTALTGVCRTAFAWSDDLQARPVAFGMHSGLYVWRNGDEADITPASGFTPGEIDGTGGSGYGTGAYGVGDYGEPSTTDYFPLTWSLGSRQGQLYANPRGQTIFVWDNNLANKAVALTNAPAEVTFMLCAWTGQVMAFGCTDTGAQFNASCIRIADPLDPTAWVPATSNLAQQFYIDGRLIGARQIGRYIFAWTDAELFLGSFDGIGWAFERVGPGGLCGPNAAVVLGSSAVWIGPDLQFYGCALGGQPDVVDNPLRQEFADNAAPGQNDKIVGATVSERGEALWIYADARDGYECSRAMRLSKGAWSKDRLARTAFIDANPTQSPIGVTYEGQVYWQERGTSADGGQLASFIETGGQYLGEADSCLLLRGLWPDFKNQQGPITLTISAKFYPQDPWETLTTILAPDQSKADFLISGRIFKFRFDGMSSPSFFRFGKPTFDAVVTGKM